MAPRLSVLGDEVLLTWLQPTAAEPLTHALRFSRLQGTADDLNWSAPATVAEGEGFFANWADNPAARRGGDGALVGWWLSRSGPDTYAYDIKLARSQDDGMTWQEMGVLHDDGTQSEHGFVSSLTTDTGVRAFWLDGREMTGGHGGSGDMTLRTAVIGETVQEGALLDERVCECCQTAAAMSASGPVVVYRDRSEGEIRDIWVVRRTAGGWSEPRPVHEDGWMVPGCPVNGPAIAADPEQPDRLVVAWFTAADNRPRVLAAFSGDGGATFAPPVVIDDADPLGRVDVAWDGDGSALVLWLAPAADDGGARILLRRLEVDGSMQPPRLVAPTRSARGSGFPRMVRRGGDLVLVWTIQEESSTALRSALLALDTSATTVTVEPDISQAASPVPGRPWDGKPGSLAPDYAATDLDGRQRPLADWRGRPVLVNFWATWCLPCREETPALVAFHQRYAGRGLEVLGISVDEAGSSERVRRFAEEEGITYTVLLDPDDLGSSAFDLPILPGSFLLDGEGRLVWSRFGTVEQDDAELTAALEELFSRQS